jgi:hypothetical protein
MCGGKVKGAIPGEPELILEYFRLNESTRVRRIAFRLKPIQLLASITEFFSLQLNNCYFKQEKSSLPHSLY